MLLRPKITLVLALSVMAIVVVLSQLTARATAVSIRPETTVALADLPGLQALTESNPANFGGMYVARNTAYVDVVDSRQISAAVLLKRYLVVRDRSSARIRLVVRVVRYSLQRLNSLMNDVTLIEPWARMAKPAFSGAEADPASDRVIIELTKISPRLRAAARRTFGSAVELATEPFATLGPSVTMVQSSKLHVVTIEPGKKVQAGGLAPDAIRRAPRPSRLVDSLPYFGGDRIYRLVTLPDGQTGVLQCTVGFKWTGSAMSTAGHCGGRGTRWTQGYYDADTGTLYKTGRMGTAFYTSFGNGRIDISLITNQKYGIYVYTALQKVQPVVGDAQTYRGEMHICADGSFTGENCNGSTSAVNVEKTFELPNGDMILVKHLDEVVSVNSTRLVQPGDSGGPVYIYSGGGISARGTIVGGTSDGVVMYMTDMRWLRKLLERHPAR
jgi:hypothetical protein